MNCFRCGTPVQDGTRFCAHCGADVSAETRRMISEERRSSDGILETMRERLSATYDVERELGRGGMAVVLRAVERELQRPVALKVMPPQLALSPESAERFKREARMTASLEHPNVIPIYRVGDAEGLFYIAMKLVDGRAVDDIIQTQGALPIPAVIAIFRGAAAGLAAAHERGIIHRDVKGGNILIDADGRVLVTDFGIARAMEDVSLTASGMIVGTPHYMSPEQCAGRPLGPQSDQYSLAAVAFQMLTGKVPFDADSLPAVMQHHFFTPPPDLATMRAGIPRELVAVVRRALAKKPEDRYASTRDLVEAIDAIPQTAEERRHGEEILRTLARGGSIPKIATNAAPTLATLSPGVPALGDARLSRVLAAARATVGGGTGTAAALLALVLLLILGGGAVAARRYFGPVGATHRAVRLYDNGKVSAARALFTRLANDYPRLPVPRIYLGRIARESHDYATAQRELQAAVQLAPNDPVALREMGSLMYVTGRFELAERFYRRAVARNPNDALARGYLGCSLVHLGRTTEGRSIMIQAGEGSWSRCG
ncbi:MAG: protein kinase [Gemmatimonadaceae bacterium]|nr:protein kinase [Gemmatimonadaceae bacterium]NUQ94447.1 protein kinase [Gemmatimonadaceae bacterium]NUR20407.1 protein kinase [Gemmatimonadaceae bacterium]NUS98987.1 protein kinase [Gemmatimonadaceae bacterium]